MPGRKPKKPEDRKSNTLRIRLTAEERAKLDDAAEKNRKDVSTWARDELLRLAQNNPPPMA